MAKSTVTNLLPWQRGQCLLQTAEEQFDEHGRLKDLLRLTRKDMDDQILKLTPEAQRSVSIVDAVLLYLTRKK